LPLPESCSVVLHPEGFRVQCGEWPEADGKHGGDFLVVIILFPGVTVCNYLLTDTRRSAGQYVWKTNRPMTQDTLPDVWIAFRNTRMTLIITALYFSSPASRKLQPIINFRLNWFDCCNL
jgi:hypothetical protein